MECFSRSKLTGQHDSAAAGDDSLAGHEAGFVAQKTSCSGRFLPQV